MSLYARYAEYLRGPNLQGDIQGDIHGWGNIIKS